MTTARGPRQTFAVRASELVHRADVNYNRLTPEVKARLARPKFPLVTLGRLAELVQYGCSQRAEVDQIGPPIVRMNNLQDDGWDFSDLKYVSVTDVEIERWSLHVGDILINRTNSKELVGKCEVFAEQGTWIFASYLIRVRLNESEVRPRFVADFLATRAGRVQIDRESRQIVGMSNINSDEIRRIRIPLPSIEEQDRLIEHVDMSRKSRARAKEQAAALNEEGRAHVLRRLGLDVPAVERARSYAVDASDVGERLDVDFHSPKFRALRMRLRSSPFRVVPLGSLAAQLESGFAAGPDDQTDDETEGIPHIRPLNITGDGDLVFTGTKRVPRSGVTPSDLLVTGDVLFNNTNSSVWVGKTAVFNRDVPCAFSNHITRIRVTNVIDAGFLAAVLNAYRGLGYFALLATNFNNQAGVNVDTLRRVEIPLPPIEVQRQLCDEIEDLRQRANDLLSSAASEWNAAKAWLERELLYSTEVQG